MALDAEGNLYGATLRGGNRDPVERDGVVFRLTPNAARTEWTETVLWEHGSGSGVALDGDGDLFSVDFFQNEVFELTPHKNKTVWDYQRVYLFCAHFREDCIFNVDGPIVVDRAGKIYGTTTLQGAEASIAVRCSRLNLVQTAAGRACASFTRFVPRKVAPTAPGSMAAA